MKNPATLRWIEPDTSQPLQPDLLNEVGGNELLARALANRGITGQDQARAFLDPALYQPADPFDLPGMQKAAGRLQKALQEDETIGVWGDFDVDGQTATSLLVDVLQALGARVKYHIPVRARESHGVNLPGLIQFLEQGVDLVLTCDTGITAYEAAAYARANGVDLLITDHHTLGNRLPDAFAIVNPQLLPSSHPSRSLAGVGVAYKVAQALCRLDNRPEMVEQQLDLVALGCVADVAALTGDVRYLVQRGLAQLQKPHRAGLSALYERADLDPTRLTEQHIGFIIAPRLNAVGRLADANPVVEFLTTDDPVRAAVFAAQLEGYNSQRRFMTEQVLQGALEQLEREPALETSPVLILAHPEWPAGVVGIVASRLVELFGKPAILLSSPPGEPAHGSARSIEGVDITAAIAAAGDLLLGYGGHPMAAGMSLEPAHLPEFRRRVNEAVRGQTAGRDLTPALKIDAYINLQDLTYEVVTGLERMAPFGAGNPPVILAARRVKAINVAAIGRNGEHLQIMVADEEGNTRRILWWQGVQDWVPDGLFDLAFTARTSNFRGNLEVELEWQATREIEALTIKQASDASPFHVLDFRGVVDPLTDLSRIQESSSCVIWQEGLGNGEPQGVPRGLLTPADTLVIWNPPPGRSELNMAVQLVKPKKVALFSAGVTQDEAREFLATLTGLVRHALRARGGDIDARQLAALLNQRENTIHLGIRWLAARGFIHIKEANGDMLTLMEGGTADPAAARKLERDIQTALEETAAFRAYYLRCDPQDLFSNR